MEMASASTILELRKLQPAIRPSAHRSSPQPGDYSWVLVLADGNSWRHLGPMPVAVQLAVGSWHWALGIGHWALGSWQLAVGKCTPLSHAIVARPAMIIFLLHVAAQAPPTIAKYSSHHPNNAPPTISMLLPPWQRTPPTISAVSEFPWQPCGSLAGQRLSSVDSHGGPALEKDAPQNLISASVQKYRAHAGGLVATCK